MKKLVPLFAIAVLLSGCESGPDYTTQYHMDKQFWNEKDYENAIYQINYTTAGGKKPCYSVPETAPIFTKLVDKQNVSAVVEDDALGVKFRYEFAEAMFHHTENMITAYSGLDVEDKFEYPQELADVLTFHLYTQLFYFELGNENILNNADDPNDPEIQNLITNNQQIIANNFELYLDYVKDEKSFTADALQSYVDGINEYFPLLISKNPKANYASMREKATDMLAKAQDANLKQALTDLIAKIDANKAAIDAANKAATDSLAAPVQ